MRIRNLSVLTLAVLVPIACSKEPALAVKPGSSITLQKTDGLNIVGRLVEVKPEHLVIDTGAGRTEVRRADISSMKTDSGATAVRQDRPAASDPVGSTGRVAAPEDVDTPQQRPAEQAPAEGQRTGQTRAVAEFREVTVPAGTVLPVELQTSVGSDTSHVEDSVRGRLRRAVTVGGVQVLPAGAPVSGHVTAAERAARVKGRARVAFRFTTIDPPGDAERLSMRTDTIARLAPATKKRDAAQIGGGAAGGAIIGGILGGGDGAAKGAAIGGAAGTGVVLSTRGKEVRVPAGTPVSVRLAAPLTIRVRS